MWRLVIAGGFLGVALGGGFVGFAFGLGEAFVDLGLGEGVAVGAGGGVGSVDVNRDLGAVLAFVDLRAVGVAGVVGSVGANVDEGAVNVGGEAGALVDVLAGAVGPRVDADAV